MNCRTWRKGILPYLLVAAMPLLLAPPPTDAQAAQAPPVPAPAPTLRALAPIDLTGYWVSVVTEDWRFRMVTPSKGDYSSVPLNPAGRKAADGWDPDKDIAAGNQCRSYGAPAIMRVPGRLHIYWEGDAMLKIDTDAGMQSRQLHLVAAMPAEKLLQQVPEQVTADWQGYSVGEWEGLAQNAPAAIGLGVAEQHRKGYLRVVTTHFLPGYLRKNGVPYSSNALLEEYFDSFIEPNGDKWLVVTTIVTDPQYLAQPFITSTHFKGLANDSGWNPSPCEAK